MGFLRMALALAVLVSHSSLFQMPTISGGLAVRCFFVLSGFFMSLVLQEKYPQGHQRRFWANRLRRLGPMYAVMLAVAGVSLFFFDAHPFVSRSLSGALWDHNTAGAVLVFAPNLTIVGQDLLFSLQLRAPEFSLHWSPEGGIPLRAFTFLLLPQAWSLAPEILFYALAPLLLRRSTKVLAAWTCACAVLSAACMHSFPEWSIFWRKTGPFLVVYFLLGGLSFRLYTRFKNQPWVTFAGSALAFGITGAVLFGKALPEVFDPVFACIFAAAVPFMFAACRYSRADRFLAEVSYPFYLVHYHVLVWLEPSMPNSLAWLLPVAAFAAALLLFIIVRLPTVAAGRGGSIGPAEPAVALLPPRDRGGIPEEIRKGEGFSLWEDVLHDGSFDETFFSGRKGRR